MSGLVVLPSGLEAQRRLLREAPQRMRYEGKLVGWADVSGRSYDVKLAKDGPAEVAQMQMLLDPLPPPPPPPPFCGVKGINVIGTTALCLKVISPAV